MSLSDYENIGMKLRTLLGDLFLVWDVEWRPRNAKFVNEVERLVNNTIELRYIKNDDILSLSDGGDFPDAADRLRACIQQEIDQHRTAALSTLDTLKDSVAKMERMLGNIQRIWTYRAVMQTGPPFNEEYFRSWNVDSILEAAKEVQKMFEREMDFKFTVLGDLEAQISRVSENMSSGQGNSLYHLILLHYEPFLDERRLNSLWKQYRMEIDGEG